MSNLLIVDGNSILNRAYYGIRPLTNKEGLNTNAIYGMINILKKHIDNLNPSYAVVAFDLKAKTFRHLACDFYKANRKPMPDELAEQLPYAKECVSLLGFNVIELEGYEADDVLGTVSKLANENVHAYILTGDRDSLQLISENVSVILVKTKEDIVYTPQKFSEEYGVTPSQFIDVKAIMGDSSDNIPGISGIGEKGAFKLIKDFNSLENLYNCYKESNLSESVKSKIENGHDMAFTSQFLAKIDCAAPINKELDDLVFRKSDSRKLYDFFTNLDFYSFIKKFNISLPDETVSESAEEIYPDPVYVGNTNNIKGKDIAVYLSDRYVYIYGDNINCFCDDGNTDSLLSSNNIICHDVKKTAEHYRINCISDIMLGAYIDSPGESDYSVSKLCKKYLGADFSEKQSAILIFRIASEIKKNLISKNELNILTDIELPLANVLSGMEKEGFQLDLKGIKDFSSYLLDIAEVNKKRIYLLAGEVFNINSPKQLADVLFVKMGLKHGSKTKSGFSTDAETLESLKNESEIINEILEYRQVMKLNSTYCEGLLKVADGNGRVHTSFNQTVAVTGRLSSSEPNLQNIPIRTELGKELRKFFVAKNSDYVLIDADYSQIELKVLAHMSKDANMIYAFNSGADIHTSTASLVFGVKPDEVTPEMRKRAKAVNFGIVYGIGEFSLSKDLHISRKEAKEYIDSYFLTYPDVHNYINSLKKSAYDNGYSETMFGRRRYIPELKSSNKNIRSFGERVAMNSPIQGTAADIIKIAMINVDKALKNAKIDARLILQVHDELIIESNKNCAEQAKQILKNEMENAVNLLVPITADTSVGSNWFDAK